MEIVTQWSFRMFEYAISEHTATLYWFAEPISEWGHLQKIVCFCAATKCRLEWNLISANVAFCLSSWCSFARSSFSTPGWHQLIVIKSHTCTNIVLATNWLSGFIIFPTPKSWVKSSCYKNQFDVFQLAFYEQVLVFTRLILSSILCSFPAGDWVQCPSFSEWSN